MEAPQEPADAQGQAPAEDPHQAIVNKVLESYKKKDGSYLPVRAYLDLAVNSEPLGRVEIDMEIEKCPKTVANFLALCAGTMLDTKGKNMHYKGTSLFRIVPKFCLCGGDIVNDNGTSGSSVYGGATFSDEKSGLSHGKAGVVSMLQQGGGPNTNGSQFFILLAEAPWLDKVNVPFGFVSRGLEVVERVCQKYGTETGVPSKVVRIFGCGLK